MMIADTMETTERNIGIFEYSSRRELGDHTQILFEGDNDVAENISDCFWTFFGPNAEVLPGNQVRVYQIENCAVKLLHDGQKIEMNVYNETQDERERTISKLDEMFGE